MPFPFCRLGSVTSSWEPSSVSSPHLCILPPSSPCVSPHSLSPFPRTFGWEALRTEGKAQGRPRAAGT